MEEDLYSTTSASQVHNAGEIFEGLLGGGCEERETDKTPYPGKIIRTGGWSGFPTVLHVRPLLM